MSFIVNEAVERYALEHSTPDPEFFRRLEEETRATSTAPQMMVGPLEGQFLGWLVKLSQARSVLEIGTFTGYSSISMALALPDGGRITSLDVNEETTAVARRYAEEAGVLDRIDYRVGPALDTLAGLDGPWDLAFIDADKPNYVNYYEAVLPKLAEDGFIVADNVLWSGRVVEDDGEESTQAIRAFNELVAADERVECLMLTVRDGMTLIRRSSSSGAQPERT
jgi:caffeoyl-CoA O-methyltransferase